MISFRYYQAGDEQEIVRLWNRSVSLDPITSKRFRNLILLDVNFDPKGLRVAFEGEKLVGCVYAVRRLLPMYSVDLEPDVGWISFFFVHPQYRTLGISGKLLHDAVTFLIENKRKNVFFSSYAPNYILPGIDKSAYPDAYKILKKHGFEELYSPVAMDRSLVGFQILDTVINLKKQREIEGYSFYTAQDKDLYDVIQFANEKFNPDWGRAIREGLLQGMQMNQIFIARYKEDLVGFCLYGGYEGISERFGPFGVSPEQQGKGIGKILLNDCLRAMCAEGLHSAWFLWTGEKTSAGYLYKKNGFEITRTFHVMKKTI